MKKGILLVLITFFFIPFYFSQNKKHINTSINNAVNKRRKLVNDTNIITKQHYPQYLKQKPKSNDDNDISSLVFGIMLTAVTIISIVISTIIFFGVKFLVKTKCRFCNEYYGKKIETKPGRSIFISADKDNVIPIKQQFFLKKISSGELESVKLYGDVESEKLAVIANHNACEKAPKNVVYKIGKEMYFQTQTFHWWTYNKAKGGVCPICNKYNNINQIFFSEWIDEEKLINIIRNNEEIILHSIDLSESKWLLSQHFERGKNLSNSILDLDNISEIVFHSKERAIRDKMFTLLKMERDFKYKENLMKITNTASTEIERLSKKRSSCDNDLKNTKISKIQEEISITENERINISVKPDSISVLGCPEIFSDLWKYDTNSMNRIWDLFKKYSEIKFAHIIDTITFETFIQNDVFKKYILCFMKYFSQDEWVIECNSGHNSIIFLRDIDENNALNCIARDNDTTYNLYEEIVYIENLENDITPSLLVNLLGNFNFAYLQISKLR